MDKLLTKYKKMSKQLKVVFWFTFVGFLQRGISIITTPIFTRVLSTSDYGMFSVFNAYYTVIVIVATLYLHMGVINNAFVKETDSNEKIVSAFQSLSLVISGSFFVIAVIFRNILSELMGLPVVAVLIMFACFMFVEPYHTWVIYKRYQFDYVRPIVVSVLVSIFTPLISVIAVVTTKGNQGIARIVSYALVNIIIPGALLYVNNYRKDSTFYDKKLWIYALSFNIPLMAHYLSETLLNQTDRIMINAYYGSSDAGIYSVAYSAASLFTIFSSAMNTAFVPWTYQKLKDKDYKSLEKIGYIVLIFLAVLLSIMIMFAPEIVYLLAGSEYSGAVYLIPTLSASVYFGYMYQLFSRIELYYEKKSYTVISTVSAAILNIALNACWIPQYGYIAAGYSTLISHIMFCIMHYLFFRKVAKECMNSVMVYKLRYLLLISVSVLIISVIMTMLYSTLIIRFAVILILMIIVFFVRNRIVEIYKIIRNK